VNNLLDVAAIEQKGANVLHKESILIRALLEDIVSSLTLSAERRSVSITLDDSIHTDLTITADRQTTYHIFFNLIGNAVKYTRADTAISIGYGWTPEGHSFTVADHGLGIPPEEREKIFEGYHRAQQAVASGESGSGLGLYLTKQLLALEGGSIKMDSVVNEGSTFTIVFPA
jgi:signal transduction histidine kinase